MRHILLILMLALPGQLLAQAGPDSVPDAPAEEEERDRGILQAFIEDNLSGAGREVRIEGFRGALSSNATLESLTIADADGVWLRLEGAVLNWNRAAILRGRVNINELSAERLVIERVPDSGTSDDLPSPEATPFALPELPVSIDIATLAIERAELGAPLLGEDVAITLDGSASLAGGEGTTDLQITRLDGPEGDISIAGSYSNATGALNLDLSFREGPGGIAASLIGLPGEPSVDLTVQGDGSADDFNADILLLTDGEERLSGTATLGAFGAEDGEGATDRRFGLDLSGDLAPLFLPDYQDFLGNSVALTVNGTLLGEGGLDLEQLDVETQSLVLNGAVQLDSDSWPVRIDITGAITPPEGDEVLLPLTGPETWVRDVELAIDFDSTDGDTWTASLTADGFRRDGIEIGRAALTGQGGIVRGEGNAIGEVTGQMALDVDAIALPDPALQEAVGETVTGALGFDFVEGQTLRFTGLDLTAGDTVLSGDATLDLPEEGLGLEILGRVGLRAGDLSRFAALAGIDLSGSADLSVSGEIEPLSGSFDLTLGGSTGDLAIGNALVDPLIGGDGQLQGQITRDQDGTRLTDFGITTPETELTATADLATGDSQAQFALNLREAGIVAEGLDGPVSLTGTAVQVGEDWTLTTNLEAPGGVRADIDANISLPDGEPGPVNGIADIAIADLSAYAEIAGADLNGAANVTLAGRGDLSDMSFEASVNGTASDIRIGSDVADTLMAGTSTLAIDLTRDADGTISFRDTSFENDQVTADLDGTIDGQTGAIDFDARLVDVALILDNLSGPATLDGTLTRDGQDFRLDGGFSAPGDTGGDITAEVTLGDDGPGPFRASGDAEIGSLAPFASLANMDLSGGLSLRFGAEGDLSDMSLSATLNAEGDNLATGITAVDPLIGGASELDVAVNRDAAGVLTFDRARFESDQLMAMVEGSVAPTTADVRFDVQLASAGAVAQGLTGAIGLSGQLTRDGDDVNLDADLTGPGETEGDILAALTLVDGQPGPFSADVNADIASLAPFGAIANLNLGGALTLDASADGDLTDLTFDADVSATGTGLRSGISAADPLLAGTSLLNLAVARDAEGVLTIERATFENPQLSAEVSGEGSPDGGSGRYDLRLANVGLLAPGINGPATATGTLSSSGNGWQIDTSLTGPGGMSATTAGSFAQDFSTANLSINGNAPLELANGFIAPRLVDGLARFNLNLNGPLALNSLSGTVSANGAGVTLPSLRIRLTPLNVTAQLGGGSVNVTADTGVSNGGRITASGPISLSAPFNANLAISLQRVVVAEPGFYETTVSGNVGIDGGLTGGANISGDMTLDAVEVRIPNTGGLSSGSLPSLVHINEPADVRRTRDRAGLLRDMGDSSGGGASGPGYGLNIVIRAPQQIFIRGRGLDAEMGGQLRLGGTTNSIFTEGSFELIRGRLDILGERLSLTEGSLQLQGNFDPYVRLVAATTSGDITVQIVIEGFASNPDLVVTSQPELPEEEVLARLLFERGIEEISALQAVQLALAVRTLAGGGGEGIVGRLRTNVGLDDLDVTTGADGTAEVTAGKYLSDRLYSDVTVDSSGETEVELNLQITPSVTARGRVTSDGDTGIGIYFERDY
ncbi:translocation/assembly module TamB domain-containing protein [Psychromarinibacter sp. S121]|uniref:translocation/assembly module TamB domain-containing protein n=1 Tax=Psychromarinibacter sp. S121 TaxID=3415127 RepID=UPI003C7A45D2